MTRTTFGSPAALAQHGYSQQLILALSLMALIQYATNSSLIAGAIALRSGERFWHVWTPGSRSTAPFTTLDFVLG